MPIQPNPTTGIVHVSGSVHITGTYYSEVDSCALVGETYNSDGREGNNFTVTLTGSELSTLANPTNLKAGATYRWIVKQGTSGSDLWFGDKFQYPNGLPPSMVSGAGGINILEGVSDGTYVYLTSNTVVTGAYVSGSANTLQDNGASLFDGIHNAKLSYWYDAVDIDTITKDGSNLVATWEDKSGLHRDASQTNGTEKPTYISNGINGFPCIDFNGSDNMMYIGSATNNADEDDFEAQCVAYFVVTQFDDADDGHIIGVGSSADGYLESYGQGMYTESGKFGIKSISSTGIALKSSDTFNDEDLFILVGIIKSNGSLLRGDGLNEGLNASSVPNPHTAYVQATIGAADGTNDGSPVDFFSGKIGEIIVFTSSGTGGGLTEAQIRSVEKYLATKWGHKANYRDDSD